MYIHFDNLQYFEYEIDTIQPASPYLNKCFSIWFTSLTLTVRIKKIVFEETSDRWWYITYSGREAAVRINRKGSFVYRSIDYRDSRLWPKEWEG